MFSWIFAVILTIFLALRYVKDTNLTNEEMGNEKIEHKETAIFCGVLVVLELAFVGLGKIFPILTMIIVGIIVAALGIFQFLQQESRQLRATFWLSLPFAWAFWLANASRLDISKIFDGGWKSFLWSLLIPILFVAICGFVRWIIIKSTSKVNDDEEYEETNSEEEDEENSDSDEEPDEDSDSDEEDEEDIDEESDEENGSDLISTIVTVAIVVATIIIVVAILI